MKMISTYPGTLILPDGAKIEPKSEVDIDKEVAKNPAVAEWIENGWLVDAKGYKPAKPTADVAQLTADLEASNAANAELQTKVDQLTADLEAATKPAA